MTSNSSTQSNASNESQLINPTPGSVPYLPKHANDILTADEWNQMQTDIHNHINDAYAELQTLQTRIEALKSELNSLNSLIEQYNKIKLDNSLPLTLHRESTDTNGDLLTLVSYAQEAPYMNFCHLPGGASTANATRYGYIQGGLNSDKKPVFLLTCDNSTELHICGSKVCINDRDILAEIDSLKKIINVNNGSISCATLQCSDTISLGSFNFKWYPSGVNDEDSKNCSSWEQAHANIMIRFDQIQWGSLIDPHVADKLHIVLGSRGTTLAQGYAYCANDGWYPAIPKQ
jgi:hypothetical protein